MKNSSLQLASVEQKKADENGLRLAEDQKVYYPIILLGLDKLSKTYNSTSIYMDLGIM